MSARLVDAVFTSALPAWVKPYAAAYASFAADDGSRVYPSVGTIARMVSRHPRRVQYATAVLRDLGVLSEVETSRRHTSTEYHFHVDQLPRTADGAQFLLRFPQAERKVG
jgi:23S rRNA A2030 N6-methylase RlmJ